MLENIDFQTKIGKNALKVCMGDLYPDPMVVYREYVQNSCDSLNQAVKDGIIATAVQKTVSITIQSNTITVHDRGIGVKKDNVVRSLIDLFYSQKNGDEIGRYGVGRLTGAKYCDELVFETSAIGEKVKSIVKFDAKKARDIIASDQEYEVNEVTRMVNSYMTDDEEEGEHYFRVTMNNVFERDLLDIDKAKKYLQQTVPIGFEASFEDFLLSPALDQNVEYKELFASLPMCNVVLHTIEGSCKIYKPYKPTVINSSNQEEKIGNLHFFKIKNEDDILAWGWFAMTVSAKQFTNTVEFRKIRLRQLNMAVGNETYLDNLYYKDVDSAYFIGEIYAVNKEIEPTTGRDGLVDNATKKLFERYLKEQFKSMNKEYNALSKFGSTVLDPLFKKSLQLRELNQQVDKGIKTSDEIKEEKEKATQDLKEVKTKLVHDLSKIKADNKIYDLIDGIVEYFQAASDAEVAKYNNKNEVQLKDAQINKFSIKNEIGKLMEEGNHSNNEPAEIVKESTQSVYTDETSSQCEPEKVESKTLEFDAYKSLSRVEQIIIKKIYKILDNQKNLAPQVRDALKAKMEKKLAKK